MRLLPPPGHPARAFVEALERADRLRAAAHAIEQSRAFRAWRALVYHLRRIPEPLVVVCAYCRRVRTLAGAWMSPTPSMRDFLARSTWLMVSHGCCPECLEEQLPSHTANNTSTPPPPAA